ncbi:hypothetical protein [Jatrophihabitans fulvus]
MGLSDHELDAAARSAERRRAAKQELADGFTAGTGMRRLRVELPDPAGPAPAPGPPDRWDDLDVLQRRWNSRGVDADAAAIAFAIIRHVTAPGQKHALARPKHGNRVDLTAGELTENELVPAIVKQLSLTKSATHAFPRELVADVAQGMAGLSRDQDWFAHRWLEYRIFRPTGAEEPWTIYRASSAYLSADLDLDARWQLDESVAPRSELPPIQPARQRPSDWGDALMEAHIRKLCDGDEVSRELAEELGALAYDVHSRYDDAWARALERIESLPTGQQQLARERLAKVDEQWHTRIRLREDAYWRGWRQERLIQRSNAVLGSISEDLPANLPEQTDSVASLLDLLDDE